MRKLHITIFCLCFAILLGVINLFRIPKRIASTDGVLVDVDGIADVQVYETAEGKDRLYYKGKKIYEADSFGRFVKIDQTLYFTEIYNTAYSYGDWSLVAIDIKSGVATELMKTVLLCGSEDNETLILLVGSCVPHFPNEHPLRLIYRYSDSIYQDEYYVRYHPKNGSMERLDSNPLEVQMQ